MKPADAVRYLLAADWSEDRIASEIGSSQPTVNRIKRGRQVLWEVGSAVIALALRVRAEQGNGASSDTDTVCEQAA